MSDNPTSWEDIASFIEDAARQMRDYGLTTINVKHAGSHIRLDIDSLRVDQVEPMAGWPSASLTMAPSSRIDSAGQTVVAPMIGTFYSSPSPGEPPFVEEGDEIEAGQVIGIIEAMKIMNEITSEFGGTISQILVRNAQAVEYGQPLFLITPVD